MLHPGARLPSTILLRSRRRAFPLSRRVSRLRPRPYNLRRPSTRTWSINAAAHVDDNNAGSTIFFKGVSRDDFVADNFASSAPSHGANLNPGPFSTLVLHLIRRRLERRRDVPASHRCHEMTGPVAVTTAHNSGGFQDLHLHRPVRAPTRTPSRSSSPTTSVGRHARHRSQPLRRRHRLQRVALRRSDREKGGGPRCRSQCR